MKVLITGSQGSLAQWIINHTAHNWNIIGLDRNPGATVQGDLRDSVWLEEVFAHHRPDYVLHCAAQIYGVGGMAKYGADIMSANNVTTINLLEACVRHGVKKVAYMSSSMVYERATSFPFSEDQVDTIAMPRTGYGASKLFGEKALEEYHKQYGLNYVIWRPFNIITPLEMAADEAGIRHVLADFVKKIVIDRCEELEILGDGTQIRCFSWIQDIADVIAAKSWSPETDLQSYNVGSETPTHIIDLGRIIWQQSGRTDPFRVKFVKGYKDDVIKRIPDCTRARALGYKNSKTIEELVDICLAHVKNH